jgi:DNA-binding MarR family transcriptional regulator
MSDKLRTEIKQQKPFKTIEEEVALNLARTTAEIAQPLIELLKTHDLTPAQYNVLRILRGAGSDGLACGDIADRLISREPDVTRLLDRMQKRGLIARHRSTADRRVVTTRLSDEGLRLVNELDEPVSGAHVAQLGHLSREQLLALIELLELARTGPR